MQIKARTNSGIQYADLSSLTLQVEQSELRKSSNVVLNPMAGTTDQMTVARCITPRMGATYLLSP